MSIRQVRLYSYSTVIRSNYRTIEHAHEYFTFSFEKQVKCLISDCQQEDITALFCHSLLEQSVSEHKECDQSKLHSPSCLYESPAARLAGPQIVNTLLETPLARSTHGSCLKSGQPEFEEWHFCNRTELADYAAVLSCNCPLCRHAKDCNS